MTKKFYKFLVLLLIIPFVFVLTSCDKNKEEKNAVTSYITYNLNGGENNPENKTSFKSNQEMTLFAPTRNGYEFVGWYTNSIFSDKCKVEKIEKGTTEDVELFARWTAKKFVVTLDYDGAVYAYGKDKIDVTYLVTIGTLPTPEKDGYNFLGWFYGETQVLGTEPYTYFEAITLTAKWEKIIVPVKYFDVIFNSVGGTEIDSYKSIEEGSTIEKPTDPQKNGYEFVAWIDKTKTNEEKIWDFEKDTISYDLNLVADWKAIDYDIEYVLFDGENNSSNPATYNIEKSITFKSPTKEGYNFVAWFSDEELENSVSKIDVGTTGNIKLYAKWIEKEYRITFNYNGATANNGVEFNIVSYNKKVGNLPTPEKNDFEFFGWYYGNVKIDENTIYLYLQDITVTAKWNTSEETKCVVSFTTDCDDVIEDITDVEIGQIISQPKTIVKNGYEFVCWKHNDKKWNFETDAVLEDMTLVAEWKIISYTITYNMLDGEDNLNNPREYNICTETFEFLDATKPGYYFDGWYLNENFEESSKITNVEKGSTGDLVLYAKWREPETSATCNIKFAYDLPEYLSYLFDKNEREVQINTLYTLPIFDNYYKLNDYFKGYYYYDGERRVDIDKSTVVWKVVIEGNVTIHADWNSEMIDKYYYSEWLEFSISNDSTYAIVSNYSGNSGTIIIPKYYKFNEIDYPVEKIDANSFESNKNISKIIINATSVTVGDGAFANSSLSEIDFSKITSIGSGAFENTNLTKVTFSSQLTKLSEGAFKNSKYITAIDFFNVSENFKIICSSAFENCTELTSVRLSNSINKLESKAFYGCSKLASVEFLSEMSIGDSILGDYCFANCTTLESVQMTENIYNIGVNLFDGCSSLKTFKICNLFNNSELDTFLAKMGNNPVESITIFGSSVEQIPSNYFANLQSLISFDMGNSVTIIKNGAFSNSTNIENVTLSNSLIISKFSINVFKETKWLKNLSSNLVIGTVLVYVPNNESLTEITISSGITEIGIGAIKSNSNIVSVTIPSSVSIIGKEAFYNCVSLETVTFETGSLLETIGNKAFYYCKKLESINLNICSKLEKIGDFAFEGVGSSAEKSIIISLPNSLSSLGESVFKNSNIGSFVANSSKYFADENGILFELSGGEKVAIVSYLSSINNSVYVIPTTVTKIYSYAFCKNSSLNYIFVQSDVEFENYSVVNCNNCTILSLNATVTNRSYTNNYSLTELSQEKYELKNENNEISIEFLENVSSGYYYVMYDSKVLIFFAYSNSNVAYNIVDFTNYVTLS